MNLSMLSFSLLRGRFGSWVAAGVILAAAVVIYWTSRTPVVPMNLSLFGSAKDLAGKPLSTIPLIFPVPAFDFVDQHGQRSSNAALRGHVWIADFIFTRCAGSCPKVTATLVGLQRAIVDQDVRFVSFSVDPDDDDPATLAAYADKYNRQDQRWTLLRPTDGQAISILARKMQAFARSDDPKDQIMHSDFLYLIDQSGEVRGLYDSKSRQAMDALKDDVRKLCKPEPDDTASTHK